MVVHSTYQNEIDHAYFTNMCINNIIEKIWDFLSHHRHHYTNSYRERLLGSETLYNEY